MIYDLICNTLQELNPNALPLDDGARLNMDKLIKVGHNYTKGFISRYDFLKSVCDIMDYDYNSCVTGFEVKRAYEDVRSGEIIAETLDIFDNEDDAHQYLNEIKAIDKRFGYAVVERR